MRRWRNCYAGGVATLWVVQTLVRLVFSHSAFHATRSDLTLHVALLLILLLCIAFIVALFPDTPVGRRRASVAGVMMIAPLHAGMTLLDVAAMAVYYPTGLAAPFALIRTAPRMLLSLLNSVGIDPVLCGIIIIGVLVLHVLLYLPVAALLANGARRVMTWRVPVGRTPGLALRWIVPPLTLLLLLAHQHRWPLWVQPGVFQSAPAALKSGGGTPSTAHLPRRDLPAARPLVLIIVDALRRDRMGVYNPALANTPFLSALAAQGRLHVFDPSFGTCTFSYCGIMSALSSHSWDDFGHRPATIIDALGRYGYHSHVMMVGGNTSYGNMIARFGGPIASLRDEVPQFGAPADDRHIAAMIRATAFPDPRHSFLYLHLMSAHAGSLLLPAYVAAARGDAGKLPYALIYDARVRQADAMLRDIFAALRARGLGDALVVITGDHGERIGEGGLLYHGGAPDPAVLAVPLIVYDPRGANWPAQAIVSQIDIAPTLLAAVGGTPPSEWRGIPLQRSTPRLAVPFGTFETTGVVGVVGGRQVQYRCDRKGGGESIHLLDSAGGATDMAPGNVPRLLALLRGWHRLASPATTGQCRH